MDVSKSHDPFAPEGTDLSAEPESEAPADPQGADADPADHGEASDVSAVPVDSEAEDAPDPEPDIPDWKRTFPAEPVEDPTSPAESDGPTDADTEADKSEAEIAEEPAPADDSAPAATDIEADTPEPEISDERGIDATEESDPTTEGEAH